MSTLVIGSGDEMFIIYGPHHPLYCANTSSSGPSTTSSSRATSASDRQRAPVIGPSFWQSPSHLFVHHHYLHKRALLNKTSRKKHHQTLKVPIQPHAKSHPAPAQPHQNSWTVTLFPNFIVIVPSHLSCRPIIKDTRLYNKPQILVSFAIAASHSLHARVFVDTLHCQSFDQFLHSFPLAT